ncbi:aminotransferase class IV [Endozoicomonas sp. SM1973]|uniref:Aminotransferase class IV n=1 Tax=Spartinivicinus marinus TaxID=2994442 RepID=A0A853I6K1_9GAMM|nr:aminotransferase class IV family protein [Spartinivicinus marinus]MCX4030121.1 aminotransferase class IV family protein [Spartinivicinus marinus]NYZ69540.1 aminotransferase class IV [Spartinivicinus marinus]
MSRWFETIRCWDGKLYNLSYHSKRLSRTIEENFEIKSELDLKSVITVPDGCTKGVFRCRVLYEREIEKIEFVPHEYRAVNSLKLVEDDNIEYHYKCSDRSHLQVLYEQRGGCDDIVIVKNGFISDTLTANLVLYKDGQWWTPDTCLLPGTQRARLLEENIITETSITPMDLYQYDKIGLINAMQDFDNMPQIPTQNIGLCRKNYWLYASLRGMIKKPAQLEKTYSAPLYR